MNQDFQIVSFFILNKNYYNLLIKPLCLDLEYILASLKHAALRFIV